MSEHDAILDMYGPHRDVSSSTQESFIQDSPQPRAQALAAAAATEAPHSGHNPKRRSLIDEIQDTPEPQPEPRSADSRNQSHLQDIQRRLSALNVSKGRPSPPQNKRALTASPVGPSNGPSNGPPNGPPNGLSGHSVLSGHSAVSGRWTGSPNSNQAPRRPRRYIDDGDVSHLSSRMSVSSRKSSESVSMRSFSRQSVLSRQTAAEQQLMQALDGARDATEPSILMSLLERVVVDMIGVNTAADNPDIVAAADRASLSLADFIARFAQERSR